MAADNAALASELRERHRIATAQRLGTAGSMGMAAPGGTPGGDQANSMVLNLDNPEESTLEAFRASVVGVCARMDAVVCVTSTPSHAFLPPVFGTTVSAYRARHSCTVTSVSLADGP